MSVPLGLPDYVLALFLDSDGAGVSGLSPRVTIRRASDGTWWDGVSAYQATPVEIAMTEVDATNAPGEYVYAFTATADGKHAYTCRAAAGEPPYAGSPENTVDGPVQPSEETFETSLAQLYADAALARKFIGNRADAVAQGDGSVIVTFFDDDDTTPIHTVTISADRLLRMP